MERNMLDLNLQNKIPCSEIRKRTKIIDIIETNTGTDGQ